ncbi:hypothetical protein APHAL10511_003444 [Amanita phalloides]|nr:hypothetical protein APHAL10511_003444 [Amanita phalloides]
MKEVKDPLPGPVSSPPWGGRGVRKRRNRNCKLVRRLVFLLTLSLGAALLYTTNWAQVQVSPSRFPFPFPSRPRAIPRDLLKHRHYLRARCKSVRTPAGPPESYRPESRLSGRGEKGGGGGSSDRYVPGTPPTLIKNAKIWTGERNGTFTIYGDVLLDKGLIVAVGHVPPAIVDAFVPAGSEARRHLVVLDARGKWVTPGLVDLHSHIGLSSLPSLEGARDTNSHKAPILPWLRSIDGLNTHDESYKLTTAGGVTTAQILPGSANNIGGQAFLIKLRPTAEGSASSKLLEPPESAHYPNSSSSGYVHWRHMKHACGENPDRRYRQTRMDAAWNFRNAYNEARKIKDAQDEFCVHVEAGEWDAIEGDALGHKNKKGKGKLPAFPEDLQWESLVDVLRGKVKLSVHCYEAVDFDMMVRLSNEFQFPIASFHHAGETYLVPDLLKKTWGGTPTIALFASNFHKKREAYRGSEFAAKILAEHQIPVVLKSDHPVLNSRYLLFEAQQAHYYGLGADLALSSVTTVPARAAGVGHRVGTIAPGYDADIAIWDAHPLTLGATPTQVFADGIAQLKDPHVLYKSQSLQQTPATPNWDCEAAEAVKWDGLPPLQGQRHMLRPGQPIRFERVKSAWTDTNGTIVNVFGEDSDNVSEEEEKVVVLRDGKVHCVGEQGGCKEASTAEGVEELVIDLNGGSLTPALATFGSPLGLVEIDLEETTNDGNVLDPLTEGNLPNIMGNKTVIRAVDGLQFGGRDTLLAYRSGVSTSITAPTGRGFMLGLSTAFDTGALHALERGAVLREETAMHVRVDPTLSASVSTQIATLRRLVFEEFGGSAWNRVRMGEIPLVVHVDNADIMATLIKIKGEYEAATGVRLRMTFVGGAEAHLIADKIAKARISVVVTMPRQLPYGWDQRRYLPGPPLTADSLVTVLLAKGVHVGLGKTLGTEVRNTRMEVEWAIINSGGRLSRRQGLWLATRGVEQALGVELGWKEVRDVVGYRDGRAAAVVSVRRGVVETFRCL